MTYREGNRRSRIASLRKSIAIIVKERSSNYLIVAFIFLAAIFQFSADVTPGWLVLDAKANNPYYGGTTEVEVGLIYVTSCTTRICETVLVDNFRALALVSDERLLEYRIEAGLGLLLVLFGCIFCCRLTCCNSNLASKKMTLVAVFVTSLLSGAATLVVVGRFGFDMLDDHRAKGDNSAYKVPYSMVMSLVGGVFAVLAALTSLIDIIRTQCCGREQNMDV